MQILTGIVDATFTRFDCSRSINAEYKRRAATPLSKIVKRQQKSFYILGTQQNGSDTELKVKKILSFGKSVPKKAVIAFKHRLDLAAVAQNNKIFVFGGKINGFVSKSVSWPTHSAEFKDLNQARSFFFFKCLQVSSFTFSSDSSSREKKVLPNMHEPRKMFATVLQGKYIYVLGGFGRDARQTFKKRLHKTELRKSYSF